MAQRNAKAKETSPKPKIGDKMPDGTVLVAGQRVEVAAVRLRGLE